MAMTNSQKLAEIRKKREEGEKNISSASSQTGLRNSEKLEKRKLERSIGVDTFESELRDMGNKISGIYGGWQTPETMSSTRSSVEAMKQRIDAYQTYQQKYGNGSSADLSDVASGYQSVLDDWDNLTTTYGHYQNADAYSKAQKKAQFDKKFGGLTYDEVQAKKSEYAEESDEYKYLNEYIGYTDLRDFDKALEAASGGGAGRTFGGEKVESSISEEYSKKLQEARNQRAIDHSFDLYKDVMETEDFAETSKYVPSGQEVIKDAFGRKKTVYGNETYEYINNINGARNIIETQVANEVGLMSAINGTGASEQQIAWQKKKGYDKLTPEEVAVYNSLCATDPDKAAQFLKDMEVTLSKRVYDEFSADMESVADSGVVGAVASSALSVPANLSGAFYSAVDSVGEMISGKEMNPYSFNRLPSNYASDIRGHIGKDIAESTVGMDMFGQNVPSFLYQTGMSIADSVTGAYALGGATAPVLGMSAYQQKAKELKEAGASEEEIARGAAISGIAELAGEFFSIEKLFKIKNTDSLAKTIKNIAKQAGFEGSEEVFTEIANIVGDIANRKESSEAWKKYQDYLDRGFDESEAWRRTAEECVGQVAWAGIGGALSGGIMGGGATAANYSSLKSTGAQIRTNDRVGEMWEMSAMTPQESEIYSLYNKYAKKGITADTISDAQLGNMYATAEAEAQKTLSKKKSTDVQKLNAGIILSKLESVQTAKPEAEKAREQRIKELHVGEKTEVSATGSAAKIEGIKVEEGGTVLVTSEGEVAAESMTLSPKDAELVAYAEGMDETKANMFVAQYDGTTKVEDYASSFELAYSYGEMGYTEETILKNKGVLSNTQAFKIYEAAVLNRVKAKQTAIDKINAKYGKGITVAGVFDDSIIDYDSKTTDGSKVNWKDLTLRQRDAVKLAKAFSQATGVNITFSNEGMKKSFNGMYDESTNTITLDINAGIDNINAEVLEDSIIPTLSHELTHWMKEKAPEMYRKVKEYALDTLAEKSRKPVEYIVDAEMKRIKGKHPEINVTEEYAMDELVARACEDMFASSEKVREMLNTLSEKEQQSFIAKVKEIFNNFMEWVNELLSKYKSRSNEARFLRDYKDKVEELSKLWDQMLEDAVQTNQSMQREGVNRENSTTTQYSIREAFAREIDQWAREGKPGGENFILGSTGDVLQGLGAIESDIYMQGDKITKILQEHPEMTLDEVKKIPQILEHPVLVLKSKNVGRNKKHNTRLVVFGTVKAKDGRPILSVLDLRPIEKNLLVDDMQKVASAYTKDVMPTEFVKSSEVLYAEKNKTTNLLSAIGFFAPITCNQSGFIGSITYEQNRVNLQGKPFGDVISVNTSNKQFSDRDSEGTQLTDEQIEYFKDSKVRDEHGRLMVMYHGTPNANFTVFREGSYFTENKGYADRYQNQGASSLGYKKTADNPDTYAVYLNIKKPFDTRNENERRIFEEEYYRKWGMGTPLMESGLPDWMDGIDLIEFIQEQGYDYDGLILDEGAVGGYGDAVVSRGLSYVAFNPEQVKNIDNLTPTDDEDIRFSDRDASIYDVIGENISLKKQNAQLTDDIARLKERLKLEKQITNGNAFNENQLLAVAKHLKSISNSEYDTVRLAREIKDVYSYIVKTPNLEWGVLMAKCYEVARDMLDKQKPTKVTNDYFKDILSDIRGARISLSEEQIQEAKSVYGDKYRNAFMGRILLTKDGISLDQKWQEWATLYPEIFDANVTGGDQITALSDIYDAVRESSETYQAYVDEEARRALAVEIYNQYWNVSTIRTTADKYDKQIKRLNFEHRQMMGELRKGHKEQLNKQKTADAIYYGKIVNDIRKQRDEGIRAAKEHGRQKMSEYRDRAAKNAKIQSITKKALTLNKMLTNNSKKNPVPEAMKTAVVHMLNAIDFSSKQLLGMTGGENKYQPTKKDQNLAMALSDVYRIAKDMQEQNDVYSKENQDKVWENYVHLPDVYVHEIEELATVTNDIVEKTGDSRYVLNEMTLEELNSLSKILTVLKTTISTANEFLSWHNKMTVEEKAKDFFEYSEQFDERKGGNIVLDFLEFDETQPVYFFDRLGEVGKQFFSVFQDAQDILAFKSEQIKEFTKQTYSDKEVRTWLNEVLEFEVLDAKRSTQDETVLKNVTMNVADAMTVYMLNKREQARKHLFGGGARVAEFVVGVKKYTDHEGFAATPTLIEMITSKLSDRQIEVAEKLGEFLNTYCTDWGNEVTMRMYGTRLFGEEENYIPIETIAANRKAEPKDNPESLYAILNMSFTKAVTPNANNQVVIRDIFSVFANHTSSMARYNAFAAPIYDFLRWYGYSVKTRTDIHGIKGQHFTESTMDAIARVLGEGGNKYIRNFLKDLNGAQVDRRGEELVGKLFSNFKLASVAWNINVAMLQPLSYIRALTVLPPKYLMKGMNIRRIGDGIQKAMKYSGIAVWKSMGYYDTDISKGLAEQIKHNDTFFDKMKTASMKAPEVADKIAWGALWKACESYVRDSNKEVKIGSDEFYDEVALKFREVVYRTQVVDSVMTRSQLMRSKSGITKGLTSFMSEPTVSYNMVSSIFFEWQLHKKNGNSDNACRKKYGRKLAGAIGVYALSATMEASIRTLTNAMRDAGGDDEDDEAILEEWVKQLIDSANPLSKLPFLREVVSVSQGYDVSATPGLQAIETTGRAFEKLKKIFLEGEEVSYKKVYTILQAVSQWSGQGFSNAYRDVIAIWNVTIAKAYPSLLIKTDE